MKIQGPGSLRPGQSAKKTQRGDSSEFLKHIQDGEDDAAPRAGAAGGLTGINPRTALQEVDDSLSAKRQARARGETILDRLEELRMGLLMGSFPRERLHD